MDKVEESGSGYEVLTEESAARWLWRLAVARELMGGSGPNEWSVAEVGDGNLNLVFIVQGPHGALVVKQALPYVRCVGEGWPLSARRAWFEWEGLSEQHRHAAGRVPTPIHYDPALFAFAMSYLSPHIILRRGVVEGREYPRAAEHLGEFLARTLYATSVHKPLPTTHEASAERRRQIEFFDQNHVHTITEELFFVDPFTDCSRNRWNSPHLDDVVLELREDEELKERAEELKVRFLTHKEALLHGDLHTGSVMVSPDDTRVIDPEVSMWDCWWATCCWGSSARPATPTRRAKAMRAGGRPTSCGCWTPSASCGATLCAASPPYGKRTAGTQITSEERRKRRWSRCGSIRWVTLGAP